MFSRRQPTGNCRLFALWISRRARDFFRLSAMERNSRRFSPINAYVMKEKGVEEGEGRKMRTKTHASRLFWEEEEFMSHAICSGFVYKTLQTCFGRFGKKCKMCVNFPSDCIAHERNRISSEMFVNQTAGCSSKAHFQS